MQMLYGNLSELYKKVQFGNKIYLEFCLITGGCHYIGHFPECHLATVLREFHALIISPIKHVISSMFPQEFHDISLTKKCISP